jgi:endogenous inhibitor of DNA gyrase (YacG/DUF329 family)
MSKAASPDRRRRDSCPLCGKPPAAPNAPFCSQGCRDRDLLNWLGDSYRVAGPPADDSAFDEPGPDSDGGLDR